MTRFTTTILTGALVHFTTTTTTTTITSVLICFTTTTTTVLNRIPTATTTTYKAQTPCSGRPGKPESAPGMCLWGGPACVFQTSPPRRRAPVAALTAQ